MRLPKLGLAHRLGHSSLNLELECAGFVQLESVFEVRPQAPEERNMKSECDFYLDRAAKCLDMAEQVDKQYRGDLVRIARRWVELAQEEAEWEAEAGESEPGLTPISADPNHA